jgi:glutamyl-tRNA reductase
LSLGKLRLARVSFQDLGPLYFSEVKRGQIEEVYSWITALRPEEAVVLWTCNRFEIYFVSNEETADAIRKKVLENARGVKMISGLDVARHLFYVASGLDSMVVGEGEILGQVREAWLLSRKRKLCGPTLNRLFTAAIEAGKGVRAQTSIGRLRRSVARESIELFREMKGEGPVLVVGAGSMGTKLANILKKEGYAVSITNRHISRAKTLASALGIKTVPFSVKEWSDFRGIFIAIKPDRFILDASNIGELNGDAIIVDLSTPYAVDPSLKQRIKLVNMEMISERARQTEEMKSELLSEAGAYVDIEFERFAAIEQGEGAELVIRNMYLRAENELRDQLERLQKRIDVDRDELNEIQRTMEIFRNRILSLASKALREMETREGERELKTVQR